MKKTCITFLSRVFAMVLVFALLVPLGTAAGQDSLKLVVHYIEASPIEDKLAYDVQVYLSVFDSTGSTVQGLTLADFSITEDSLKVDLASLETSDDIPMSVVLLLDTSGSMSGTKMNQAKAASQGFINQLGENDQAALISFSEKIRREMDFTIDKVAVNTRLKALSAVEDSGTCLYDAAYEAVQLAATLPSGRRAVVLLTDGVDELPAPSGLPCSAHNLDDVIGLAASGNTRVPIFTIGLGNRIDEQSMKRLSDRSGGVYHYSPDAAQLEELFSNLADQLKNEYVLNYVSAGTPGAHTLVAEVKTLGVSDLDTRDFMLPAMPAAVRFLSLADGQTVHDAVNVSVSVSSGELVDTVVLLANDTVVADDSTVPFEFEWNTRGFTPGDYVLEAVAKGKNGEVLASRKITVRVEAVAPLEATPTLRPTPTATAVVEPTEKVVVTTRKTDVPEQAPQEKKASGLTALVILGGAGLLIVPLLIILGVVLVRRRQPQPLPAQPVSAPAARQFSGEEKTYDAIAAPGPGGQAALIGTLTVIRSDDPTMVGQVFNISKPNITLGRSSDNDFIFPKDTPVSRKHAFLTRKGGSLILQEVVSYDENRQAKYPTYGTYVNGEKVPAAGILLTDGDTIRLGNRLEFTLHSFLREELTMDDLGPNNALGGDRTFDNLLPETKPNQAGPVQMPQPGQPDKRTIELTKPSTSPKETIHFNQPAKPEGPSKETIELDYKTIELPSETQELPKDQTLVTKPVKPSRDTVELDPDTVELPSETVELPRDFLTATKPVNQPEPKAVVEPDADTVELPSQTGKVHADITRPLTTPKRSKDTVDLSSETVELSSETIELSRDTLDLNMTSKPAKPAAKDDETLDEL